jgi:glycosyltransferase involved in cell wall biosynthesis
MRAVLLRRLRNKSKYTIAINMAGCDSRTGGVQNYAESLIRGWACYIPWNPLSLYCTKHNFEIVRKLPLLCRLHHHYLHQEKELGALEGKIDLLYCPFARVTPAPPPRPVALHLPGLPDHFFPEFFSLSDLSSRRNNYRNARAFADHLLVSSKFSKKSIVACLQIPEDRISIVPLPVADLPKKVKIPSKINDLQDPFIYYPADNYAHKNHQRLFLAIAELLKKGWKGRLICTGERIPGRVDLATVAKESGISSSFLDLGEISREEVSWLYQNARLLIFPSLFESFGLPIIEAFEMELPIVCSGVASIPELGGDAVLYCNPFEVSDIAEKIGNLWSDQNLRSTLSARGKERREIFDTKNIVEQHLAIFSRVIDKKNQFSECTGPLLEVDLKLTESLYREAAHESIRNQIPLRDHWFPSAEMAGMKNHGSSFSLQSIPKVQPNNAAEDSKNDQRLPVHFFTIVHNGMPFIKKHLEVFEQLSCKWHWHIIEGVAMLQGDTAWSLKTGGRLPESISILSSDGTQEYLDVIAQQNPDHITLYRKNDFWKGKLEMISAPLSQLPNQALLWEVDVDEIWNANQIMTLVDQFAQDPTRSGALFYCRYFISPDRVLDNIGFYANHLHQEWRRVWNYKKGDIWKTHEPPCLLREVEPGRLQDVMTLYPFTHEETWRMGLIFDHFSFVTEAQVEFKELYYGYHGAKEAWKKMLQCRDPEVLITQYCPWIQDPIWAFTNADY